MTSPLVATYCLPRWVAVSRTRNRAGKRGMAAGSTITVTTALPLPLLGAKETAPARVGSVGRASMTQCDGAVTTTSARVKPVM